MLTAAVLLFALHTNVPETVIYSKPEGAELGMDIYRPAEAKGPLPAVLLVHGGGWTFGARQFMEPPAKMVAESGMVGITVSYRLAPKTRMPGILEDVRTAVRYVRSNATTLGIDPNAIGAIGHSAGGQLSLMTAYTEGSSQGSAVSSRLNAVFNFAGPTDFRRDFDSAMAAQMIPVILGKKAADAGEDMAYFSPITHVDKSSPPTFLLHGSADSSVPLVQSRILADKLRENGVPVELEVLPGDGHMPDWKKESWRTGFAKGIAFLKKHLSGMQAAKAA